jgi:DNA-binding NarL/FixJ family response regulator
MPTISAGRAFVAYRGCSLISLKSFSRTTVGKSSIKIMEEVEFMQMFPLESQTSNIVTTRRDCGPDRSSTTKSPIDSPMKRLAKVKVLIIHHAPLVRSGLVALMQATGRFAVCGETDDAPTAREMFVKHRPQLVALGLTLRRGSGIELIKDFRRLDRTARILVISGREDTLSIQRAFRAGTHGYLALEDDSSEVLLALERISDGHLYASASVMRRLLKSLATNEIEPARSEVKALSDRELEVFSLIGRGFGASRLATELHLSVKTVETYQAHIKQKLGLHSAAELSEKAAHWTLNSMRRNLQLKKLLKNAGRSESDA